MIMKPVDLDLSWALKLKKRGHRKFMPWLLQTVWAVTKQLGHKETISISLEDYIHLAIFIYQFNLSTVDKYEYPIKVMLL